MIKVLVIDEFGGFSSVRLVNDFARAGAQVYLLREFTFQVPLPRGAVLLPPESLALPDRLTAIDRAVKELQPDAVIPMDEPTLLQIWESRPPWLNLVQPRIDMEKLSLYGDKRQMEELARSLGLPLPETYQPEAVDSPECRDRIAALGLPVVVKGIGGCMGEQVRIVESVADAQQAITELYRDTGVLPAVQQFIGGAPYQSGGLFDKGRPVRFLTGEKIAIHPPRTGPAIALTSESVPELLDYSRAIMTALEFSGLAGIDFIRDTDGRFYFLEVNPRIWGSYGLARSLGIDLFGAWCRQIEGETLDTDTAFPVGKSWAKMPEYVLTYPQSRVSLLRRLCRPIALKSLAWSQPSLLYHQWRRIGWALRK